MPFGVSTVEICPNGMFLASIGQDGNLFIHRLCNQLGGVDSINPEDPIQPELLLQRPTGRAPADNAYYSDAALHHMAFSPDGRYCAACGAEGRFLLVGLSNMRVHEFPVCEEDEGLLFVAFDRELSRDTGIMSRHLALCSTKVSFSHCHRFSLDRHACVPFRPGCRCPDLILTWTDCDTIPGHGLRI